MSNNIHTINFNTPFLVGVPNSRISPEWIRLLGAVIGAVNSPNVISSDDFQAFVFSARKPVDQSGAIDELRNTQLMLSKTKATIADLTRRLTELESQVSKRALLPVPVSDDEMTRAPMPRPKSLTQFPSGGAAPAGGSGTAAGAWDTAGHRDSAIATINNMRTALIANGILN